MLANDDSIDTMNLIAGLMLASLNIASARRCCGNRDVLIKVLRSIIQQCTMVDENHDQTRLKSLKGLGLSGCKQAAVNSKFNTGKKG